MICSSVCLLRLIVWSFLKARLQFTLDQFNGATSQRTQRLPEIPGVSIALGYILWHSITNFNS